MTITASQKAALNDLSKYVPAVAANRTAGARLLLGDEIAAVLATSDNVALVAALKTAFTATSSSAVATTPTAIGTVTVTALGTDTITAFSAGAVTAPSTPSTVTYVQAESTALADAAIALRLQNLDLIARQAENKVAIDDMKLRAAEVDVAVASLATTLASVLTENAELKLLVNELKSKFDLASTGVDALA